MIPLTTTITAPIAPSSEFEQWPTHKPKWGLGGLRTVLSLTERDEIIPQRREPGMLVCVYPPNGTPTYYALLGDLTTWMQVSIKESLSSAGIIEETLVFNPYASGIMFAISTTDLGALPADASLYVDGSKCACGLVRDRSTPGHRFQFYIGSQVAFTQALAIITLKV